MRTKELTDREPVRKLVVGLGNPGAEYRNNRHNAGFQVLDSWASQKEGKFHFEKSIKGSFCKLEMEMQHPVQDSVQHPQSELESAAFHAVSGGAIDHFEVYLLKPATFMNCSGESVLAALSSWKIEAGNWIVVQDDVLTPLGKLKIKQAGSAAGHNGLKSIEERLRTQDYPRLRIGIGEPALHEDLADYVLSDFTSLETEQMSLVFEKASRFLDVWVLEGLLAAAETIGYTKKELSKNVVKKN